MDDLELLARELKGVTPLAPSDKIASEAEHTGPSEAQLARRAAALAELKRDANTLSLREPERVAPHEALAFMRPGIQLGVWRKLRLGQYEPQVRLDLHRMTVEEARRELWDFVQNSRRLGLRCVMVLHGRGELAARPAWLKSYVNQWLRDLPEVLAFHSASRRDGGEGALYVLLKKSEPQKQLNREQHGTR
ncbi:MAG: DNA endonuclease SmrA [Gammaproteobacteria bacterium]|nr:DNA endonuclease SmrA [Gammaproteobacteria bacterium]